MSTIETFTEPTVELIDHMGGDIDIAYAAWVSNASGDERANDPSRIPGLLNYLVNERHGSPFEQVEVKFRVEASIMVFREWHRHRTQSYNEQSGRYTKFEPVFYVPGPERPLINIGTSARPNLVPADEELHNWFVEDLIEGYEAQWSRYERALEKGISKEMARLHLSTGIRSTMYAKANLRNWMKFLGLRTSEDNAIQQGHPQYEIVQCAKLVEEELTKLFPTAMKLYNDHGRVAP